MKGLTPRQQQILDYITESIQTRGYPPTIREIGVPEPDTQLRLSRETP